MLVRGHGVGPFPAVACLPAPAGSITAASFEIVADAAFPHKQIGAHFLSARFPAISGRVSSRFRPAERITDDRRAFRARMSHRNPSRRLVVAGFAMHPVVSDNKLSVWGNKLSVWGNKLSVWDGSCWFGSGRNTAQKGDLQVRADARLFASPVVGRVCAFSG